ncbi:MAG TPA: hypothetical protein PKC28_15715, partial [Bdellovibrionales bacterium]|nr:hypothetical protein [Bdellovibrionales bacterium]
ARNSTATSRAGSPRKESCIDGVLNKVNPGSPLDKDIYGLPPEEAAKVPSVPKTLDEAIMNLRKNHDFLLKGEVFSEDMLNTWLDYKYDKEIIPMQQRPSPYEFYLYYDL